MIKIKLVSVIETMICRYRKPILYYTFRVKNDMSEKMNILIAVEYISASFKFSIQFINLLVMGRRLMDTERENMAVYE